MALGRQVVDFIRPCGVQYMHQATAVCHVPMMEYELT